MRLRKGRISIGRAHRPITAVLAAFVLLGVHYALSTPPFEAPDEPAHYAYVRYLVENRSLPPLIVSFDEWEQGQMHQPPLYYFIGAVLAGGMDSEGWEQAYPPNPYAALGQPRAPGNVNAVLHSLQPTASAQRTARALGYLRVLSLACSAVTVWLTYRLALLVSAREKWFAVGAASMLAFNPQFLFISASVNNDLLVTVLAAGTLLTAAHVAQGKGRPYRTPIVFGLLTGLAGLAKLSGLATMGMIPIAYVIHYHARDERRLWPDLLLPVLLAGVIAIIASGWWYARNALSYGDPLGMQHYAATFAVGQRPMALRTALATAIDVFPSYWGVFGWMNILAPEIYYIGFRILTVVAVIGTLIGLVRAVVGRIVLEGDARRALYMCSIWGAIVALLILRWTQTNMRTQGRLAFPAAPVLSIALMAGITVWIPRALRKSGVIGITAALFLTSAVVPSAIIARAYAPPPRIAADSVPETVSRVQVKFGDQITLVAAELLSEEAIPGEHLRVRLYWAATSPIDESYTVSIQLLSPSGERLGGIDTLPGKGLLPTTEWQAGEVIVDEYAVLVYDQANGPLAPAIRVGLYSESFDRPLKARDADDSELGSAPEVARIRLAQYTDVADFTPPVAKVVDFGGEIRLVGYDLAQVDGSSQDSVLLTLFWECLAPPGRAYSVFVHLLDEGEQIVSQADAPPLQGGFPTDFWQPGDRIRDPYIIEIPADQYEESLLVRIGLYSPDTGARLAISGARNDYVDLVRVTITGDQLLVYDDPR